MTLRIVLFILSVAAIAAFGLFTQARAEGNGIVIPLPDPRGPITEDFERGACYVVRMANKPENLAEGVTITSFIMLPNGGIIECPP
jgi:hypothetical protein